MKPLLVAALGLGLGAGCLEAQAQDTPRQLGGAPAAPVYAPRPATTPPAAADPTPAAAAPATTVVPGPATAPQPVQGPPPVPGQLMGGSTRPTRYQVGLRNGQLYNVADVDVRSPLFGRSYLLLDGQRRVDLDEVGFYETETGHYVRTTLPGSSREATLRRERTGRLSLYATYNTSYSPGYYGAPGFGYGGYGYGGFGGYPYGGGGYRTTKTEYFSKDNGPIQYLNTRNLAVATADNAGAQALLARSRSYQRGVVASYVVAGGLLVAGLSQSLRGNSQGTSQGISALTYLALPVLIVPLVLQSKQAAAQRQAIALYNGQ